MIVTKLAELTGEPAATLHQLAETPPYKKRRIAKKRGEGKTRGISVPAPLLLKVLQATLSLLEGIIHDAAHCTAGRSAVTAARVHAGSRVVVNLDLIDFYDYCTQLKVYAALRDGCGYEKSDAIFLSKLCCFEGRLPQGAPTSTLLANFVAVALDERLAQLAQEAHCRYTRFGDDLTFSSSVLDREGVAELIRKIRHAVARAGFRVNDTKVSVAWPHQQQAVLGIIINPLVPESSPSPSPSPSVRAPRTMLRKLRAALHTRRRGLRKPKWTDDQIRGAIAYVNMVDPEKGRVLLDEFRDVIQEKLDVLPAGTEAPR